MATHSSLLARKFHGQRSVVGYSPWCHKELDTTEPLNSKDTNTGTKMTSPSPFPFQYFAIWNPIANGGAWWAVVYGVAQSGAQLKRLSSSKVFQIKGRIFLHFTWQSLLY